MKILGYSVLLGLMFCGVGHCVNVGIYGSPDLSINADVDCSTSTATLLLSLDNSRKGFAIRNNSSAFNIRISTWANTSQTYGYTVGTNTEFSDNIEAYMGAIYAISTGTGTASVTATEKLGVIYR